MHFMLTVAYYHKPFSSLRRQESEDLLNYNSPVSGQQLTPAQKLQWKITSESARDIETAKMNIDKYMELLI